MGARLLACAALVVLWALLAPATGAGTAVTTPECGAAVGDDLEQRLPVGPFDKRVGQTLCFDFTGDGREDIVFTGWEFADNGAHYWAAFRARGDDWSRVIFKRDCCRVRRATKIRIARLGGTILVRQPIFRPGNKNCCPTGGTQTGRWRWNGVALKLLGTTTSPR